MADYRGKVCMTCGRVFVDGDDVVVCPVCGTPHHRQCWDETGKCANEERHKDGYVWNEANTDDNTAENSSMVTCRFCGNENRADALFCTHCGKALFDYQNEAGRTQQGGAAGGGDAWRPFYWTVREENYGDEKIEGVKTSDIASYARENSYYYIRKFRMLANGGKKVTTNWAACFFSYLWWFSRKNYLMGTITALINMVFAFLLMPSTEKYMELLQKIYGDGSAGAQLTQSDISAMLPLMGQVAIIGLISLGINFVISLFANRIYLSKAVSDIKKLNEENLDDEEYRYMLGRKGGLSLLTGLAGYFGLYILESVLMMVIEYIRM